MFISENERVSKIFFYLTLTLFLYTIFLLAIESYEADIFDGSLKILSRIYISKGLIPYKDFSVVYPPGLFLLIGKILPFSSIIEGNIYLSILYVIIVLFLLYLLKNLIIENKKRYLYLSIFLLFVSFYVRLFGQFDAFSLLFIYTNIFLLFNYIKRNSIKFLFSAFLISFFSLWFRWEWMLFLNLIYLLTILVYKLLGLYKIEFNNQHYLKTTTHLLLIFGCSSISGYLLSLLIMLIYFHQIDVINNAFQFIVAIPLFLTSWYRDLPLPIPKHPFRPEMIFYLSIIILFYLLFLSLQKLFILTKKHPDNLLNVIVLFLHTIIFLIYALGRSDWPHFVPLWFAIGCVWIILDNIFNFFSNIKLLLILFTFLPLASWYIKVSYILIPRYNYAQTTLNYLISDCQKLVKNIYAESIFVGRKSYEKYLWNNASLYLTRPDLKPASSYITEEPGIQNVCKFQNIIVDELNVSPKPMIVTLELHEEKPENKATTNMKSCGLIERYLEYESYRLIGYCRSDNKDYEIRLYN